DECLAESFILNPDGGAVACIFNSREGLVGDGDNAHLYTSEFIELQFWELFVNGSENLGKMMQQAKEHLASAALNPSYPGSVYRWCYYEINLLGDPESPALTRRHYLNIAPLKSGFGISFSIENICRDELTDIDVTIESSSRLCIPRRYTTNIEQLWPEEQVTFKKFFLGFGQSQITVKATVDGVEESRTFSGFLFGPFVFIRK
ncbi:MAG: C25 family cysteine peptidase, partial [Petrotogales bacterium]